MEEFTQENQNYLEDAKTTLELCNQLKSLYDAGSLEEKAGLAKIVASNYSLIDGTLYPQMRKPFDLVAKGLSSSEWLPESYPETTLFRSGILDFPLSNGEGCMENH